MTNILVVTGSVRPNSVNSKIVPIVEEALKANGATVTIADLAGLNLPFFNGETSPNDPSFSPNNEAAQQWTRLVDTADSVVLVSPEYKHNLSPVQLNAIDWIGKEWKDKPVVLIGYGWGTGGGQAHDAAREALAVNLGAKVSETQANLFFTKDIAPDGSIIDEDAVTSKIQAALASLK